MARRRPEPECKLHTPFRAHSARLSLYGSHRRRGPAKTELPGRGAKMNIKRKLSSLTAAVALASTTLVPIASSANAEPWNGGHRYGGYAHNDRGDYGRGGDYGH